MRRFIGICLLWMVWTGSADAQQTVTRVLGIYPTGQGLSGFALSTRLTGITTSWNASSVVGASGVIVTIVNTGQAYGVNLPGLPTDATAARVFATNSSAVATARSLFRADIVVLFMNGSGNCGETLTHWPPFNGNSPGGLDLNARNDGFLLVVRVNALCPDWVAAHEFGHAHGGDHATESLLYPDARAYIRTMAGGNPNNKEGTAIATFSDVVAPATLVNNRFVYSRNASGFGDATHQNTKALIKTAPSVANYFLDPQCPIASASLTELTLDGGASTVPDDPTAYAALVTPSKAEDGRDVITDYVWRATGSDKGRSPVARVVDDGVAADVLYVRHPQRHPDNERFAPTPNVEFKPQTSAALRKLNGSRGFAAVTFGESGSVLDIRVMPADGKTAPREVYNAFESAVGTSFTDNRRHDHTAYWAYRVEGGTLQASGPPIVTQPQCLCPCPLPPPGQEPSC